MQAEAPGQSPWSGFSAAPRLLRVQGQLVLSNQRAVDNHATFALSERAHPRPRGKVLVGHQACLGHGGGHTTWT